MPMFKVIYKSMTACYGPSYIQADTEHEARIKFARNAFSKNEMGLIHATLVSDQEIQRALQSQRGES